MPRGGKSLVARVQQEARVPVIGHLEGNCHVYVDRDADLRMARAIVLNAKMRRTGICGAAETLLVDAACAATHLAPIVRDLLDAGCEVRGDATVQARGCTRADRRPRRTGTPSIWTRSSPRAWSTGVDAAIAHIARYGSAHTESIVTANAATAERFLARVDSAIVLHNASTQFADGGEFGMGAEIGISTDRFHARGPVGVRAADQLQVRGARQRAGAQLVSRYRRVLVRLRAQRRLRRRGGAALAVHPAGVTAEVVLLLPDRHAVLDLIDDVAAGAGMPRHDAAR